MFRSLRKAAESLEKGVDLAFSTPGSQGSYVGRELTLGGVPVRLGSVFAEGGFSHLHSAVPLRGPQNQRFAVKRLACPDAESRARAQEELDLLVALPPHPNIVRFIGGDIVGSDAFLMFEMVDGGTLPERLDRKGSRAQSPEEALAIFADAVAAVVHLHSLDPPLAVRDVKLENLLYDRLARSYKLCDFGSCTRIAKRYMTRSEILKAEDEIAEMSTAMYRAPEMVDLYQRLFICEKVDVWALGCIWHALLFGELPFDGQSSLPILKGLTRIPTEPRYPESFIKLLRAMFTISPADRPDVFTVCEVVKRLQGLEMDPGVREVGASLRRHRAKDFASDAGTNGTDKETAGGSQGAVAPAVQPVATSSRGLPSSMAEIQQVPYDDFFAFNEAPSQLPSAPNLGAGTYDLSQAPIMPLAAPAPDAGDGWADFDSAFGEFEAPSPAVEVAPPLQQLPASASASASRPRAAPPHYSPTATQLGDRPGVSTPSLTGAGNGAQPTASTGVSLSGLQIGETLARPPAVASAKKGGENSAGAVADFSDLIDFMPSAGFKSSQRKK